MLTWALCWLMVNCERVVSVNGLMFLAMIFDLVIFISISACFWAKHIK